MVEGEQPLVEKSVDELDEEERVARGLLVPQPRQRGGARQLAAKRIRNELIHVLTGEGRELDFLHGRSRVPYRLELQHQRMGGADFVVAIRSDQHEMPEIRPSEHVLEQIERRGVEPLQVVEKERERMFGSSENPDESPEHVLEAPLRVLRGELGHWRLVAHGELALRGPIDPPPFVWLPRPPEREAPAGPPPPTPSPKAIDPARSAPR